MHTRHVRTHGSQWFNAVAAAAVANAVAVAAVATTDNSVLHALLLPLGITWLQQQHNTALRGICEIIAAVAVIAAAAAAAAAQAVVVAVSSDIYQVHFSCMYLLALNCTVQYVALHIRGCKTMHHSFS
jgi:hypothetical protein